MLHPLLIVFPLTRDGLPREKDDEETEEYDGKAVIFPYRCHFHGTGSQRKRALVVSARSAPPLQRRDSALLWASF